MRNKEKTSFNGVAKDIPGFEPRWRLVRSPEIETSPYAAVAALRSQLSGRLTGTAWLIGSSTAVTAAHALVDDLCLCLGSGSNESIRIVAAIPHPDYRHGEPEELDRHDLAVLQLEHGLSTKPLRLVERGVEIRHVEVPGYLNKPENRLVTHEGPALATHDALLLHEADTRAGHSGAPVLLRSTLEPGGESDVVALHVGGFNLNPYADTLPARNTALLLTNELRSFVRGYLNTWR